MLVKQAKAHSQVLIHMCLLMSCLWVKQSNLSGTSNSTTQGSTFQLFLAADTLTSPAVAPKLLTAQDAKQAEQDLRSCCKCR